VPASSDARCKPATPHPSFDAAIELAGDLVLLADQDRSLWDTAQIATGRTVLDRALALRGRGPYVVQAAIAPLHATTPSGGCSNGAWRSSLDHRVRVRGVGGVLRAQAADHLVEARRVLQPRPQRLQASDALALDRRVGLDPVLGRVDELVEGRMTALGPRRLVRELAQKQRRSARAGARAIIAPCRRARELAVKPLAQPPFPLERLTRL
jgi:hypothetical protein